MIYFTVMLTEETRYRVFLHLLTDDLIDTKNEKKDQVFEQMINELLHLKLKQKNNSKKHD